MPLLLYRVEKLGCFRLTVGAALVLEGWIDYGLGKCMASGLDAFH